MWMIFGLGIGLSVALAIYMKDREPVVVVRETIPQPASLASAMDNNNEQTAPEAEEPPENRFDFYNMLPNFEVIIPEEEPDVAQDMEPKAVELPGTYVLQAGSFTEYGDADRRRAQLALHGVESRIQRVTIDDKTYHRVRIGPTRDLNELNALRSRLRAAKIDVLRIRLGD
jgi:cell division protein FtsN